jgi:hypothetical protein
VNAPLSESKQLTQQFLIMTFKQKEIMANYEKKMFAFQQNNAMVHLNVLKNFTVLKKYVG